MPVESATYISELSASNPSGSAPKSEGDNHIRLIKSVLQSTFPAISGAVSASHIELNYVDGVTSAIQTQLDAKAPINNVAHTGTFTATACSSFTIPTASSAASSQEAVNAFWVLDKIAAAGAVAGLAALSATAGRIPLANGSGRIDYNWIGGMSSADLRGLLSDETGTGSAVFGTSPTITSAALVTPSLGIATATSINFGQTAFNHYQEGTWTPVIGGSGGTSGQSYDANTIGWYTRVGRKVDCQFYVALTTKGTITTNVQIQGLPFTVNSSLGARGPIKFCTWSNLATTWVHLAGRANNSATNATIQGATVAAAASTTLLTTSDINNNTELVGSVEFFV